MSVLAGKAQGPSVPSSRTWIQLPWGRVTAPYFTGVAVIKARSLKSPVINKHRQAKAKKRTPSGQILALESHDLPNLPQAQSKMSPDQIFNYVWATEIIDQVIAQTELECNCTGKEQHWTMFQGKVLAPIMQNKPSPPLKDLCRKHGVANEAKASNMIITVKRAFRRILEERMQHFVQTATETEDEINEILGIISQGCAG